MSVGIVIPLVGSRRTIRRGLKRPEPTVSLPGPGSDRVTGGCHARRRGRPIDRPGPGAGGYPAPSLTLARSSPSSATTPRIAFLSYLPTLVLGTSGTNRNVSGTQN